MTKNDSPICPICGIDLTIKHIMTEYPLYSEPRLALNLQEHLLDSPNHKRSLLSAAFKFITKVEIQNKI